MRQSPKRTEEKLLLLIYADLDQSSVGYGKYIINIISFPIDLDLTSITDLDNQKVQQFFLLEDLSTSERSPSISGVVSIVTVSNYISKLPQYEPQRTPQTSLNGILDF